MAKGSMEDKVPEENVVTEIVPAVHSVELKVVDLKPADDKLPNGNGKNQLSSTQ